MRSFQLTERNMHLLAPHFIQEAEAIDTLINALQKVQEALGRLFCTQLIRSFWSASKHGEVQFSALRQLMEERSTTIQVLITHGLAMADD